MIKFADEMTYPELEISLGEFKKPYNVGGHTDFETLKIWITSEFRKRGGVVSPYPLYVRTPSKYSRRTSPVHSIP